ncbi:MAG: esterase [Clostridia bacterium]|nr:esterase [Clostridia bacterium]MBR4459354.1 esterase [Clostridia bacterium]
METQYFNEYSPALGHNMEVKVWGHAGRPVLYIPCQNGRFFDFESFHMSDIWAPWIDAGKVMVFSIDTVDPETWSDPWGNAEWRIARYEQWISFITGELVPFMRDMVNARNGWTGYPGIIVTGCSLGATHAANLYFRFPDLFDGLLALSGIYTASYGFGTFTNEAVYRNSLVDCMANMPADHPYIEAYNRHRGIIVCGQGPWEVPDTTLRLRDIFNEKGIHVWVDVWGHDVRHDWDWWYRQAAYHIPHLID